MSYDYHRPGCKRMWVFSPVGGDEEGRGVRITFGAYNDVLRLTAMQRDFVADSLSSMFESLSSA